MGNKSEIIIGCMSRGKWGKQLSTLAQSDLIQFCVENGNTTFDHADIYGDYSTEAEFGKALKESGVRRDEIQLISKCGIQLAGTNRNNKVKHYDYSKSYIISSAEASLRQLNTDYLDTFLLHRPSPLMEASEIAEAITALKDSGKIVQFGVSNFSPSQVDLIAKEIPVFVNQIEFSLTHNDAMHNGTLDYLTLNDVRPLCWSPLGMVYKEENEHTQRIKSILPKLAGKYDVPEDSILLSWILKHPSGISPVIGTTSKDRIRNANQALQVELELEDWFILLEASQGHEVA